MKKTMKELLRPEDFADCAVWCYDEDQESYFAVRELNDLEEAVSSADLKIRAQFITSDGRELQGVVVGVRNIYAIGLFVHDEIIMINKNMRQDSKEQVAKYLSLSGLEERLSLQSMFPLRYESRWGNETFNDFSGVFELSP